MCLIWTLIKIHNLADFTSWPKYGEDPIVKMGMKHFLNCTELQSEHVSKSRKKTTYRVTMVVAYLG